MDRALASARARQEVRTFFASTSTAGRRNILQSQRMGTLFVSVLNDNRDKRRMLVHEFVVMPDHVHFLITPSAEHSLEKCMQFIKGGFSFRAKRELIFPGDVWSADTTKCALRARQSLRPLGCISTRTQ